MASSVVFFRSAHCVNHLSYNSEGVYEPAGEYTDIFESAMLVEAGCDCKQAIPGGLDAGWCPLQHISQTRD